jgi:hypothetical protein
MDGFQFSLSQTEDTQQQPTQPCLNLLFPSWTLDTREKFYVAIAVVFLASFCLEGLSAWRYRIVQSVRKQQQRYRQQTSTSTQAQTTAPSTPPVSTQGLRFVLTLLHGLQGLLGYLVMLAVMTYSAELLFAVVLGLALGYATFFQFEEAFGRVHVTSNPCCSFLKGEAREIQPILLVPEQDESLPPETDTLTTPLLTNEGNRGAGSGRGGGENDDDDDDDEGNGTLITEEA